MADEAGTGAQNGWRHFRLAERAARFGYWRLNLADSKMFWSDGLYRLLGLEPGSVEPTTDHLGDTMLADEIEMVREAFEMSIRGRKPFYCRTHAKDTDRLAQVVDTHGEVEMDETGRVIALVGVCRDMTAQVTAEKERELAQARYSAMAEEASDIIVLHENGEIAFASSALERLLKRPPEDMKGGRYLSLVHPDDIEEAKKLIGQPPPGAVWTGTYRIRHADGHYIWFEVSTRGVYDETSGEFHREISVGRDITERKRQELAMRTAQERAEAANRAKSQFLANMSHELRTPLNAIIGFADVMRHHMLGSPNGGRYDEYAHLIHDSAQLLLGHISGILEMANIEGGKLSLTLETFALKPILENSARLQREGATQAGLTISVDCADDLVLMADRRAVEQILLHLLSNAIKFTPRGGHVTLCAEQREGRTILSVSDDGLGIPEDVLPRLGRPFEQVIADPLIAKPGVGTGLGLALVRSLVERHDGRLRIDSEIGEGTTVFVEFPQEAQRHAA
jgi:two-component system, cell cycle sensor histidine kinase PleC